MIFSVIWTTMFLQMKQSFSRSMFRFCLIANPILNTVLLYEMYRNSGKEDFLSFVILGAGLMALWSCICFSSAGDINRERFNGTLPIIFSAPVGFSIIILGKILGNTVLALLSLLISMITAYVLFGVNIYVHYPLYFLIAMLALVFSFVIISICIACVLTLSRKTTLYMNCIEMPIILLCGFVYPIESIPSIIRPLSYCLAPTWAVELLRMSVSDMSDTHLFWNKVFILLGLSGINIMFSIYLFKMIDKKARISGSLEVS